MKKVLSERSYLKKRTLSLLNKNHWSNFWRDWFPKENPNTTNHKSQTTNPNIAPNIQHWNLEWGVANERNMKTGNMNSRSSSNCCFFTRYALPYYRRIQNLCYTFYPTLRQKLCSAKYYFVVCTRYFVTPRRSQRCVMFRLRIGLPETEAET